VPRLNEGQNRILTTHVGSLPRPDSLSSLLLARMTGKPYDEAALHTQTSEAVRDIVIKQTEIGIDIVSDGEQSKASFQHYVTTRLSGLSRETSETGERRTRENVAFPAFYKNGAHSGSAPARWCCTGPISYVGDEGLRSDLSNFKAALGDQNPIDAFMPSVSPSSCAGLMTNRYYKSDEEHVFAVAEALRHEYEAIVDAGFCVQIDDPRLAMHYMLSPEESVDDARRWARQRIEALNHALRNIPPERIRHHTCYGINMGPRTSDFEMRHLADLLVTIKAGYYSFEMANPRHEHEWRVWEEVRLPEGRKLAPGVVTQASVVVEHPDLVAQRICRLAEIVGRGNVVASTDCGFASNLTASQPPEIPPEIVWAKLSALVERARRASTVLWAGKSN
jgi:5-methyltetrahydropteroyltriglutamate--homocysteine methyltransferase